MNYNYYHILNVSEKATAQEIKRAYKKLAIQYHPDKHQGNTYFEDKFKLVNEAYQVLSDPQKRATYDVKLQYLWQHKLREQAQQQQRYYYQGPIRRPASVTERHYRPIPKSEFLKKDYYILIAIFAGIIAFCLLLMVVMNHIAAKDNYKQALVRLDKQEWGAAHSYLTEAINFKPKYAEAFLKRAYIEMEVWKDFEAARTDLDAAIAYAEEKTPQMYYLRGKCYEELKNTLVAESNLSQAIQTDKHFALAYYDRGILRARRLNKFPEAIQDLTQFLKFKKPDSTMRNQALYYRGFCYYITQQSIPAIKDYYLALQQEPQNARLYYMLGKAQVEVDSTTVACQNFNRAVALGYLAAYHDIQLHCSK